MTLCHFLFYAAGSHSRLIRAMDAAIGTTGSKIPVSPAVRETTGQFAVRHRDDLSHHDATFLTGMGFDFGASGREREAHMKQPSLRRLNSMLSWAKRSTARHHHHLTSGGGSRAAPSTSPASASPPSAHRNRAKHGMLSTSTISIKFRISATMPTPVSQLHRMRPEMRSAP